MLKNKFAEKKGKIPISDLAKKTSKVVGEATTSEIDKNITNFSFSNILKTTRENMKIPLSEIAKNTKINIDYLKAIEDTDYEELPEKTYILGYVSLYAKYLKINNIDYLLDSAGKEIDKVFSNHVVQDKIEFSELATNKNIWVKRIFAPTGNSPSYDKNLRITSLFANKKLLFATIIVIVLALFVLLGNKFINSKNNALENIDTKKEETEGLQLENFQSIDKSEVNKLHEVVNNNVNSDEVVNNNVNSDEVVNNNVNSDEVVNNNVNSDEVVNNNVKTVDKNFQETDTVLNQNTHPPSKSTQIKKKFTPVKLTPYPKETLDRYLIIRFTQDSWVRIFDSKDYKTIYMEKLFKAGSEYIVPKVAQLSARFGNYTVIQLELNGQNLNLKSSHLGSILTIDLDEKNLYKLFS